MSLLFVLPADSLTLGAKRAHELSGISPHFRPRRHRLTAEQYRNEMSTRFAIWNEVIGLRTTA